MVEKALDQRKHVISNSVVQRCPLPMVFDVQCGGRLLQKEKKKNEKGKGRRRVEGEPVQ
jgi:hypothetical protein